MSHFEQAKWYLSVNDWSHLEQANGFPPVWILSCSLRMPLQLNVLSYFQQVNCFSPKWILSWRFKVPLCLNSCQKSKSWWFNLSNIFATFWAGKVILICKWLLTFGAGKWLLSCVYPFMLFQNGTPVECLVIFPTEYVLAQTPLTHFPSFTIQNALLHAWMTQTFDQ